MLRFSILYVFFKICISQFLTLLSVFVFHPLFFKLARVLCTYFVQKVTEKYNSLSIF